MKRWLPILILALLIASVAPFVASSHPDALEFVAEHLGFAHRAAAPALPAPLPDYALPGHAASRPLGSLAGILGTGAAFGLTYGLGWLLARRRRPL